MAVTEKTLSYFSQLEIKAVLQELQTSEHGLNLEEAERRLAQNGLNKLVEEKRSHVVVQFLANFKNPLVLILLCAASVSFVLGARVDAGIIFIIVFLSVILNFFQEYSANKAAQKLKEHLTLTASALRDGELKEVVSAYLCTGDILELQAGDLVPADGRVIAAKDFFVNQSSLTGESFPIEKRADALGKEAQSLNDLTNIVFSGSNVETGTAHIVVVKTGAQTEFGKISDRLSERQEESEFNKGVTQFSLLILRLTVFFVIFIFFFNTYKQDVFSSLLFSGY
jgi:Mg2+-importing ATPase